MSGDLNLVGHRGERWRKIFNKFLEEGREQKGNVILREEDESTDVIFLQAWKGNPLWVSLLPDEPVNSQWNSLHK